MLTAVFLFLVAIIISYNCDYRFVFSREKLRARFFVLFVCKEAQVLQVA